MRHKTEIRLLLSIAIAIIIHSCKKNVDYVGTPASFNVVNVIPSTWQNGILPVFGGLNSPYYYGTLVNSYGGLYYPGSFLYSLSNGNNSFYAVNGLDTTLGQLKAGKLISGNYNLKSGSIYSLFIGGDTTAVDTLFTQDNIPYYPHSGDSVAGLRIVNMSTGSQPYTISIAGNPFSQAEFSGIAYKNESNFKNFSASKATGGGYNFTLWDNMGDSLSSFYWSFQIYRCNTIVISGSASSSAVYPLNIFQMNNF